MKTLTTLTTMFFEQSFECESMIMQSCSICSEIKVDGVEPVLV